MKLGAFAQKVTTCFFGLRLMGKLVWRHALSDVILSEAKNLCILPAAPDQMPGPKRQQIKLLACCCLS
jgi:hypothetical protein